VRALLILGLASIALAATSEAEASLCRNYTSYFRLAVGPHVERLRSIEREAVRRIDEGAAAPLADLGAEAGRIAAEIADGEELIERESQRCRNWIPPVRRVCSQAAEALAALLARHTLSIPPRENPYREPIRRCERYLGLAPLATVLRTGA
jgi:hypothetical protein